MRSSRARSRLGTAAGAGALGAERTDGRIRDDGGCRSGALESRSNAATSRSSTWAQHTSRTLPLATTRRFWSGQEGSLLLWLLILTGYSALAVWLNRRARDLVAWVVPVLAGVAGFFVFMLVFISSPFATSPAPADGAGMVPSLQNPYMLAHPPILYLGYVGTDYPVRVRDGRAALAAYRRALDRDDPPLDARCVDVPRVGQLLGAHWAYVGSAGWLLRLGSGRERGTHAVARRDRLPAFVMIQEKRGC